MSNPTKDAPLRVWVGWPPTGGAERTSIAFVDKEYDCTEYYRADASILRECPPCGCEGSGMVMAMVMTERGAEGDGVPCPNCRPCDECGGSGLDDRMSAAAGHEITCPHCTNGRVRNPCGSCVRCITSEKDIAIAVLQKALKDSAPQLYCKCKHQRRVHGGPNDTDMQGRCYHEGCACERFEIRPPGPASYPPPPSATGSDDE